MGNVWQSLKQWFGILWLRLKQLYVFLLPLRFSFLALGILVFAFRFSDQGTDILRALAGEDAKDRRLLNITLFLIFSNLLAYEIWYWSRHLLKYRPHIDPDHRDPIREPLPQDLPVATEWIPRLLGLLVFGMEIVGCVHFGGEVSGRIVLLAASAVLYLAIVITRRSILRRTRFKIPTDAHYEQKTSLAAFEPV